MDWREKNLKVFSSSKTAKQISIAICLQVEIQYANSQGT